MFMLLVSLLDSVNAQKWNKETKKAFKNAANYSLVVNFPDLKVGGLDSAEFVTYYCDKKKKKPEFFGIVLKRFKYEVANSASKHWGKKFLTDDTSSDFVFNLSISDITEDAGFTGVLSIYPRGQENNAQIFDFKMKDGRMNTFDVLLLENAEKLGKRMAVLKYAERGNFFK